MSHINTFFGFIVDAMLQPFDRPWPALVATALATAVLMLVIIRWTSSPKNIRRAKNRLTARVLELVLFRHDAGVSFTSLGRILAANAAYLGTLLQPLAFSLVPCLLILSQLTCWFSFRPLRIGERACVEVTVSDGYPVLERPIRLFVTDLVQLETDGLRIPRLSEVDWRVRAERNGGDWVEIFAGDEAPVRKLLVVGETLQKVSQRRTGLGFWQQFLYPAEPPIEGGHSIVQVAVRYPERQFYLGHHEVDWLVAFLGLTIFFSLILKQPLRVQF